MLVGTVADYDRKFTVDVISDQTDTLAAEEGVDFEPFDKEYTIPANGAYADINIVLKRRETLKQRSRRFTVKLNETPELHFMYTRRSRIDSLTSLDVDYQRVVFMNENFPRPGWWTREGQKRFGDWSQTKAGLCDEYRSGSLVRCFGRRYFHAGLFVLRGKIHVSLVAGKSDEG